MNTWGLTLRRLKHNWKFMNDAAQNIRNLKQAHEEKKPRTRYINPKSEKRVIEEKEYLKKREVFLKKHPICQWLGCKNKSKDVHHKSGRSGKNYLDGKTWAALCREHHNLVHLNNKVAFEKGLSTSRLKSL